MGTFILKYWFYALPTALTGLALLRLMKLRYEADKAKKRQPVPITIRKRQVTNRK